MKKIVFVSVAFCLWSMAYAQGNKSVAPAAKTNPHLKVFKQAMTSGDVPTGIIALNYFVNDQGANTVYEDTLAMLYMQEGSFVQCYYWTDRRLKVKPDDNGLMEMKGICLEKLQQPKEAITIFETLYKKTQSPYHAYKLMEMQYGIKRLVECLATAASAEKLQYKPEYTMTYNVGEQTGRTYLQAGIYNVHALALYDLDKKTEAKTYFEKALALDSNFVLARQNLEALNSIETGINKNSPVNPAPPAKKQD